MRLHLQRYLAVCRERKKRGLPIDAKDFDGVMKHMMRDEMRVEDVLSDPSERAKCEKIKIV